MVYFEESIHKWLLKHRAWLNQFFKDALKPLLRSLGFVVEDWEESDHPRDANGKFSSGGGGGEKNKVTVKRKKPSRRRIKLGKKEAARVLSGLNTNYRRFEHRIGKDCGFHCGNYYYRFHNRGFGEYTIHKRIRIAGNEGYIRELERKDDEQ